MCSYKQPEKYNKNEDIDYNYREIMARNLSCPVENLLSMVGPNEFEILLCKYSPENFYTGDFLSEVFEEQYKNVLNKIFRINLHMHTIESDGDITPEELLNQAEIYAKSVKSEIKDELPPFIISITDHDSVKGVKQALKLIAENPDKFKNIKFVAGIEFSVTLDNEKILKKPLATDLMGYCINPFDDELNIFLENTKSSRYEEAQKIISKINEYGIDESLENAENSHVLIKNAASMAYFDFIKFYIFKKYKNYPKLIKYKEEIEKLFEEKQTKFSPSVREVAEVLKKSSGYIGLAHPGRLHLSKVDESKVHPEHGKDFRQEGLYLLLKDSVDQGSLLSEANYQYTMRHFKEELYGFIDITAHTCEETGILKTGGTDGHRANIFTHQQELTEEQLKQLLGT